MYDPWEITDDDAFGALVMSDDETDTDFVNMIPSILDAEGKEPNGNT
jgi:hypothetical protein